MKKGLKITIAIFLINTLVSVIVASAATNYVISANKISYSDNSSLGVDNVQAAIDGTCTKFDSQLKDIRKSLYPVGSIYLSTSLTTESQVADVLGGTWEKYGQGKTLVGVDSNDTDYASVNTTGGEKSVTLSTSNLPNHTHTYTPSGSNSYTTSNVTSGNNSANPSVTFSTGGYALVVEANQSSSMPDNGGFSAASGSGWWANSKKNAASIKVSGSHTHTVTAASLKSAIGTIKFTGTASSTTKCTNCSGTAINIQNPYITVYMYKRTA